MRLRLAAYIASDDWRKKYDEVDDFSEGFAGVWLYSKGCGFVNTEGVEVVEPQYDEVGYFHEGFAKVRIECLPDKWGFVNTEGKEVIKPKYSWVNDFNEGFALVRLNDKWGFVNTEGVEIVKPKYDKVYGFHDGFAGVNLNGKCGLVNTQGEEVIPLMYSEKEWMQLKALVDTEEYGGTKEQQYNQAHEEFQIWKKKKNKR